MCHQPNGCALAAGATGEIRCWCMQEPLLAAVPDNGEPACLCRGCMQRLETA